jgi:DNA-binding transcriptional ArsR family regulator
MGSPWKAIADDSRRQILVLLKEGEMTPSEIAKSFHFTLPALSAHLKVLKEAELVNEERAHQGWRYFELDSVAPRDESGVDELPPQLYGKLTALALV